MEVRKILEAGEMTAKKLMKDQNGVIWPTVVVMEMDEKDDDIPMLQTDDKAWRTKGDHFREWVLKAWSANPMAFDSPEFEIASFIRRKKGMYFVYVIGETAMIIPPKNFQMPTGQSFYTGSDEQAAVMKKLSQSEPKYCLSIMALTFQGFHHRALELIGPKNSPQRRVGKLIFEASEAHPPEWLWEAVRFSYSKLGKGELLN
jgi:hypothetical protein